MHHMTTVGPWQILLISDMEDIAYLTCMSTWYLWQNSADAYSQKRKSQKTNGTAYMPRLKAGVLAASRINAIEFKYAKFGVYMLLIFRSY